MKAMMQRLLAATAMAQACLATVAWAQADAAPTAPWQATCQAAESQTLRHLFASDECEAQFFSIYNPSDVATTHAWMLANRSCFKEWAHFSWIAYSANEAKMSDLAWVQQLYMTRERVGPQNACTTRACLVADVDATLARGETTEISAAAAQHTNAFLDEVQANTAFQQKMEDALGAVEPLCLLHLNLECPGAMRTALNWMYPHSYRLSQEPPESMTFSMLAATRQVFTDTLTQKYATRLALHLLRSIESGDRVASGDNFYELAVRYFEGDYDRLWNFIAVYATRGAAWATGYQMVHADNQPLFAAMMVISSAMGYLDTQAAAEQRAWSYVQGPESTCYQPKPYHYWMAGSFAYLLHKAGYSARTSKQVARLLGALYEAGSTTMGRDPDEVYFVPTFDPKVNRVRREVAHHALGALAGIGYQTPPPVAFDATLGRLMEASVPLPNYTEEEMRAQIADRPTRWRLWTRLVGFYETFND